MKLVSDLNNKAASFKKDENGSILPLTAILLTTLALAGGAAVDYSRYSSAKNVMNTALDAAILDAGIRLGSGQPVDQKFEDDFNAFFNANITGRGGFTNNYEIASFSADEDTGEVSATVTATLDTTLMRIGGIDELNLSTTSAGIFEQRDTEVTIMLDATGSMNNRLPGSSRTRLDALKSAAGNAVNALLPDGASTRGVRVGLVPYGSSINVGQRRARLATTNNNIVQTASLGNFADPSLNVVPNNGCVTERGGREAFTNAFYTSAPVGSDRRSLNGRPTAVPIGGGRVAVRQACPDLPIRPLTNDINALQRDINNLVGDGFTAGHLGVAWSYYMLSENWARAWPNNAAAPASSDVTKVAILMTDGSFNTAYEGVANGNNPFGAQANLSSNSAIALCDNMKAATSSNPGITIYSIAFAAPAAAEATLRNCASDDAGGQTFFFSAADEAALNAAFEEIVSNITSLRLSQ